MCRAILLPELICLLTLTWWLNSNQEGSSFHIELAQRFRLQRENHLYRPNLFWVCNIPLLTVYITSVSKKPGQTIVLYHYCGLSRFFWNRRYLIQTFGWWFLGVKSVVARSMARLAQYKVAHSRQYFFKKDLIWEFSGIITYSNFSVYCTDFKSLQLMVLWSQWLLTCWLGLLSTGRTIQVNIF